MVPVRSGSIFHRLGEIFLCSLVDDLVDGIIIISLESASTFAVIRTCSLSSLAIWAGIGQ